MNNFNFDDELENIKIIDAVTSKVKGSIESVIIYPATLFAVDEEKRQIAIDRIRKELEERIKYFKKRRKVFRS